MSRFVPRKGIAGIVIVSALVASFLLGSLAVGHGKSLATSVQKAPLYSQFVQTIAQHHNAPFYSKQLASPQDFQTFVQQVRRHSVVARPTNRIRTNIQVNQDRNPWPKAGVAAAINPESGQNYAVMTNDFSQFFAHQSYHVTTNAGGTWVNDSMASGIDPTTFAPYSFQSDPGIAFDRNGDSYLSTLSGNVITDFSANYVNFDTEVDLTLGYLDGAYSDIVTTAIDRVPCNGSPTIASSFNCPGQLDKPLITVDTTPTASAGHIYVYYTYFCNGVPAGNTLGPCMDGNISIPPHSSAILESHAAGAGLPFSAPRLVSGSLKQAQYSDMAIDSRGVPHIFFDDFSAFANGSVVNMYESTLAGANWSVVPTPVVSFKYFGLNNRSWSFRSLGTVAPGCAINHDTAYCAFSASQVGPGRLTATPQVYLAQIDAPSGHTPQITRVNNDDPVSGTKDHFFPWASVGPNGAVYVGWYDNRNDPYNSKVEYFVGKSTDRGKTFPIQRAVSDVAFNPCAGFPGCSFFGDYYQLVTGPDNVTHATWADTRDGVSMQIFTQELRW